MSARGAYADVLLHSQLARSGLGAVDRAFATELVYGTLRWRGRLDYLLGRFLDRPLDKLEGVAATALRLGAYQILFIDRVPDERGGRRGGALRARGGRRARHRPRERGAAQARARARERARCPRSRATRSGTSMHAHSLPAWIAARWLELFGPAEAAALAAASTAVPPLTVRVNPHRGDADELLDEVRAAFPDARRCRWARYGARARPARQRDLAAELPRGPLHGAGRGVAARGGAARPAARRARARHVRGARRQGDRDRGARRARRARCSRSTGTRAGSSSCAAPRGGSRSAASSAAPRRDARPRRARARGRLRPRARRRAVLGARHACAATPTRAGACARRSRAARRGAEGAARAREPRVEARRRARLQYLHAAARGERGGGRGVPARVSAVRAGTLRARRPRRFASSSDAGGYLRCWPHRHDTDGFFAARARSGGREPPRAAHRAVDPLRRLREARRRARRASRPAAPTGSTST